MSIGFPRQVKIGDLTQTLSSPMLSRSRAICPSHLWSYAHARDYPHDQRLGREGLDYAVPLRGSHQGSNVPFLPRTSCTAPPGGPSKALKLCIYVHALTNSRALRVAPGERPWQWGINKRGLGFSRHVTAHFYMRYHARAINVSPVCTTVCTTYTSVIISPGP